MKDEGGRETQKEKNGFWNGAKGQSVQWGKKHASKFKDLEARENRLA